ncbi:MAG: hypothetical protein ACP6IS_05145 [Candidatus Asgardarchaeia archaeon]
MSENERNKDDDKAKDASTREVVTLDDISIEIEKPKRRPVIKRKYQARETISASIPGWLKAALDLLASTTDKYHGFGGKSRFITEALEEKLEKEFPELYKKLKKLS